MLEFRCVSLAQIFPCPEVHTDATDDALQAQRFDESAHCSGRLVAPRSKQVCNEASDVGGGLSWG